MVVVVIVVVVVVEGETAEFRDRSRSACLTCYQMYLHVVSAGSTAPAVVGIVVEAIKAEAIAGRVIVVAVIAA